MLKDKNYMNNFEINYPEYINSNNLLIVIVTYNPSYNLHKLVRRCNKFCHNIVIVDNGSSDKSELNLLMSAEKNHGIRSIVSDRNRGIAWALNEGIREGLNKSIKWILTFDQDSLPDYDFLKYYNYIIINESNIGLIGCNNRPMNSNKEISDIIQYSKSYDLISSGLLHSVNVLKEVGLYDEDLFIDYVDFEYVLRCNTKGFRTYLIHNRILCHCLGNPIMKKFFFIEMNSTNHNPLRRYYRARNHILILRRYLTKFPKYLFHKNNGFLGSFLSMIFVDDDKIIKINNTIKGLYDGIMYKKKC